MQYALEEAHTEVAVLLAAAGECGPRMRVDYRLHDRLQSTRNPAVRWPAAAMQRCIASRCLHISHHE